MSYLEKNLAAMVGWTEIGPRIQAAGIPEGFEAVKGADGTETFLRVVDGGGAAGERRMEWLGGTSMPVASARPLIAALEYSAASGLGLSIGTGHEWVALAERVPPAQAIFVYEPDAGLLRMALTVCDMAGHLKSGKILLFTGSADEAGRELITFLDRQLGYDPPTVLHPLPTLAAERRNGLLAAGETVVRRAVQARQVTLNALLPEFESALASPATAAAAMTIAPRYPGERPLHKAIAGEVPQYRLGHHATTSLAGKVEFLTRARPAAILSDFFRAQLGCIPPAIPVETWIPPLIGPAFWQPERLPAPASILPRDRIVVHAGVHKELFEALGIPAGMIELRPLIPGELARAKRSAERKTAPRRVAMIADLPQSDAAALGLQLPTHEAIYRAAYGLIAADYAAVHFHCAEDVLRRALLRAGVAGADMTNAGLHDPMLRMIRDVLILAVPPLTLARTLVDQEIPVLLIGDWPNVERAAAIESMAGFLSREDGWDDIAGVVHLSPWATVPPALLNAWAADVPIIAPRHPTDGWAGALPGIAASAPALPPVLRPQPQQLLSTIKGLLRDGRAIHT